MVSGGLSIRLPYSRGDMSVTSEPMPLLSAFRERLYTLRFNPKARDKPLLL